MVKYFLFFLLLPLAAFSAEPIQFNISQPKSSVSFEAVQNGAKLEGSFKNFSGAIKFHPQALEKSTAIIKVETGSIISGYDQVASTLKTAEWFSSTAFPIAVFEASKFHLVSKNNYKAEGNLTLRGKKQPLTVFFSLNDFSKEKARVTGRATIKRSQYAVGWKETAEIKDEVKVLFSVIAESFTK